MGGGLCNQIRWGQGVEGNTGGNPQDQPPSQADRPQGLACPPLSCIGTQNPDQILVILAKIRDPFLQSLGPAGSS